MHEGALIVGPPKQSVWEYVPHERSNERPASDEFPTVLESGNHRGRHMADCDLREANGEHGANCDGDSCVFWRAIEQIGQEPAEGCAIRHYRLLGDEGVSAWLLSVKKRLDDKVTGSR